MSRIYLFTFLFSLFPLPPSLLGASQGAIQAFAYQGMLRDSQGRALSQKSHTVAFRLYDQATGGTPRWGRRHSVTLDKDGNFIVELSDTAGEAISGVTSTGLDDVLARYAASTLYLGLTIDAESVEIEPRQKILEVPAASYASNAARAKADMTASGAVTANAAKANDKVNVASSTVKNEISAGSLTTASDFTVQKNLDANKFISGRGTIPVGGIIPWYGQLGGIPKGWAVCDGNKYSGTQTPDLRSRFIVGSGTYGYSTGSRGGEEFHRLTIAEMPSHNHNNRVRTVGYTLSYNDSAEAASYDGHTPNNGHKDISGESAGGDRPHENRPPYYALFFIMRVE